MPLPLKILLPLILISLGACASSKDRILPADGPTMKSIYSRHFNDLGMRATARMREQLKARPIATDATDLTGYSRDALNELDAHFPRLPNPTLVMYVFPHLAGAQRVPVPGYATTFPLYSQVEYALPGEVAGHTIPAAAAD